MTSLPKMSKSLDEGAAGELFPQHHFQDPGLRVVAIGGGTGLSTLLHGLRRYVDAPLPVGKAAQAAWIQDLSAVVCVTDDGGSSGRLRSSFNMLPPGDVRNCMVALSQEEDLLAKLFNHRFQGGDALAGHSFGNLFLAALTEITGDFAHAVELASKVLATKGRIYPATTANATLTAKMADGTLVAGETKITASKSRIAELTMQPQDAPAQLEALESIIQADLITLGPGSLYTSIVANLLVKDIAAALASAQGTRVYICNLMSQANESLGLTASEHVERIYEHARAPIFDYVMVNTAPICEETLKRYELEGSGPIEADTERLEKLGVKVVRGNFAREDGVVRHAAERVAEELLALVTAKVPAAAE